MQAVTTEQENTSALSARGRLEAFIELTKPRIAFLLVLTSAAGYYAGSIGTFDTLLFVHSMLGITLLAFGVATLNQWYERAIDPLMERTAGRPIPAGKVTPTEALVFGISQCLVAELYLLFFVNILTAALGLTVIAGYVLVYTPLKTKTSASTAIGAFPGAMPPLMGWTAATNEITLGAWALFAVQFLWQFPHFLAIAWLYREQYAKAGILMLPVVEPDGRLTARQIVLFTLMLVPVSLGPFFLGFAGIYFLIGSVLLGIWFLFESVKMARSKTDKAARKLLLVSVIYLPLYFLLMVIDKI
ncbi:MAG: heme o synthase [Acidobacteria bacterium]|nr:heme o synthase [Acidobacteriota bacterium]